MPQSWDMWQILLLPIRRKACWGFLRTKNPTASAGFKPGNLGARGQHANNYSTEAVSDDNTAHAHCMLDTMTTHSGSEYVALFALPLQQCCMNASQCHATLPPLQMEPASSSATPFTLTVCTASNPTILRSAFHELEYRICSRNFRPRVFCPP